MTVATEDGQGDRALALRVCRASSVCFSVWPPGRFPAHQVTTCAPSLLGSWATCRGLTEVCERKWWELGRALSPPPAAPPPATWKQSHVEARPRLQLGTWA